MTAIIELLKTAADEEILALLEREPAQANARVTNGVSALMLALYYRKTKAAQRILSLRPELDIFEAAATGDLAQLRTGLARDPSAVTAQAPDGFTALHLATFFSHTPCVELLIEEGADVNAVAGNPSRVQPLHSAAAVAHYDGAALLLRHGAAVNAQQHGGFTALHSRAMHADERMTKLLLDHGADPTLRTDDGRSAADMAKTAGHVHLLALLSSPS